VQPLTATANGTYDAPEGQAYDPVIVNVAGGGEGTSAIIKPLTITHNGTYTAVAGGELKYDTAVKFKQTITVEEFETYMANATPTMEEEGQTIYALSPDWEVLKIDNGDGTMLYIIAPVGGGPEDPMYASIFDGWVTGQAQEPVDEPPFATIPEGSEMSADLATTAIFFDLSRIDGYAPITVDASEVVALIDPNSRAEIELYSEKVEEVVYYAFCGVQGLKRIELPNALKVGSSAFYNCFARFVVLPKVQSFDEDTDTTRRMFVSSNLQRIYLRDIEKIRSKLFYMANSLQTVVLASKAVVPLENVDAFERGSSTKPYIYVPKALVEAYKTATNWSAYASQIRAIEDYPEECEF
jgi:hypothetical protein